MRAVRKLAADLASQQRRSQLRTVYLDETLCKFGRQAHKDSRLPHNCGQEGQDEDVDEFLAGEEKVLWAAHCMWPQSPA